MASILVADDEDMIRRLLKKFLEKKGHEVETAANGTEAIEKIKKAPDIVLLDIMLPDMDGIEVLDKIKEITPSAKVILMTGMDKETAGVSGLKDDFVFVTKPMDLNHLEQLINIKIIRKSVNKNHNN